MKKQYTAFQVICAMVGAVIYTISILDMLGVTNVYEQITEFVAKKTKRYFGNEVGVMNRNHRSYDQANIWDCIQHDDYIQSMLRQNSWIGEIDHPSAKVKGEELTISRISNPDMKRSSHYIRKPRTSKSKNLIQDTIIRLARFISRTGTKMKKFGDRVSGDEYLIEEIDE